MNRSTGVIAQYESLGAAARAIETLRAAGFEDLEVFSPIPAPELEEAMDIHGSPVRRWALIGGATGCLTGLLLTSLTSLAYPLITQGKPIVAIQPFIVIMFELTILLTGIFALLGMLVHGRLPSLRLSRHYRKTFSEDRYGVYVATEPHRHAEAEKALLGTDPVEMEAAS
jgi:hypothetical protein